MKKTSSLPPNHLNRETTSCHFLTNQEDQHPADPDDNETTLNKRPKTNDTEPSETSPFKGILSTSLSSGEMNENHHRIVGFFPEWDQMDWPPSPNESDSDVSVGSNPFEDILCPLNSFDRFKAIVFPLNSSEASEAMNEIGFLAGTNSVGLIRRESVQTLPNTSSVGSNWYSGDDSATSGSVGPNPTQLCWWDQSSHPDFPESEFRRAFKMSKSTFDFICSELDPVINNDIPVRQRVAVCIWLLATGDPLRLVSNRFGLGISTCRKAVLEVCEAIRSVLMSKFLKWPDEGKMTEIKREFELLSGIQNVGGSMHTTHVPIIAPKVNGPAYFNKRLTERNRKTSHSITIQGVVDSKGMFTDVCIGWPGSMSDGEILEKSVLSQRASRGLLKDVWIVGNGGYPLMDWVLVPYAKQDTWWTSSVLNENVVEVQRVAKEAFSRLKGRWSCLQKRIEVKPWRLPVVLGACCVLHNICEMRNEAMDPAEMSFDLFVDDIVPEINSGPYCGGNSWAPGESLGPLMQIDHQTANDSFQIGTSTRGADRLFFSPSNQAVGFLSSDFRFDRSMWPKVRAVMKLLITVRRVVAAEKRQGSNCHEVVNSGPYCGGNSWAPGESLGSLMLIDHQTANDSFQIGTSTWGADRLFFSPSNQAVGFLSSDFRFDRLRLVAKSRWRTVRAVMKWIITVRRVVAAEKMQGSSCHEVVNSGPYFGGNSWAPGESLGPLMQIGHQTANDSFQIGTSTWGADTVLFSK